MRLTCRGAGSAKPGLRGYSADLSRLHRLFSQCPCRVRRVGTGDKRQRVVESPTPNFLPLLYLYLRVYLRANMTNFDNTIRLSLWLPKKSVAKSNIADILGKCSILFNCFGLVHFLLLWQQAVLRKSKPPAVFQLERSFCQFIMTECPRSKTDRRIISQMIYNKSVCCFNRNFNAFICQLFCNSALFGF